jgi:hypothetical protein
MMPRLPSVNAAPENGALLNETIIFRGTAYRTPKLIAAQVGPNTRHGS